MYGRRSVDTNLLLIVTLLLAIGVLMVFSSSYVRAEQTLGDPYYYVKRQVFWLVLGTVGLVAASQVQYWHWRTVARPLLYVTVLALVLVLVPGVGEEAYGSRRWIGIGPLGFQPSEMAKVTLIIFFANYLARHRAQVHRLVPVVSTFLAVLGLVFGLIMLQPDLGTAVAIGGTSIVLLFAAGVRIDHLIALGAAAVPAVAYLIMSEPYRRQRFLAFLRPEADPLGSGYHIIQSLYALGSGGLFGVGFFAGRQKFFYLPAQHTDFIYAVLGEELGFLGTLTVLLLFAAFAWRGYRLAVLAPDLFGSLLATGLTTMVVLQAIINIGVVTASLPITGISLPFVSYGGSSLVFSMFAVGILLNLSKYVRA